MRAMVRRAMTDGAFGVGSALIYPPDNYATTAELIEIARAMAPYGGVYITHMRNEGNELLEAIDEAIRIGHDGGVPVEIYHLKAAGQGQLAQDGARRSRRSIRRARPGRTCRPTCISTRAAANGFASLHRCRSTRPTASCCRTSGSRDPARR